MFLENRLGKTEPFQMVIMGLLLLSLIVSFVIVMKFIIGFFIDPYPIWEKSGVFLLFFVLPIMNFIYKRFLKKQKMVKNKITFITERLFCF